MANHAIFIPRQIGAMNVDIWNRHAIAGSAVGDIDNGNVFRLTGKSTEVDESEVWLVALPSASPVGDVLWMAYSGEDFMPSLQLTGGADEIKNFTNVYGKVFPAFKPQLFDLITLNADAFTGAKGGGDNYAVPSAGSLKLAWAAADPGSGLCFKLIQTVNFSFGATGLNSSFADGREPAYVFECIRA